MAFQRFLPHLLLLVSLLPCFIYSSGAYKFTVGGKQGWVSKPSENYNQWAGRNRFKVNDTIYFKYKKGSDSVLVVNKDDYEKCNTQNPLKKYEDGDSEIEFDRSGPFYFISGKNCNEGQKLIVVVLAIRPKPGTTPLPSPGPGARPPVATPPAGSTPISPFPSPSTTPASAPSPKSQAPTLAPSSPSPTSQAPAGSPAQTPSTSPSPVYESPTGSPTISPAGAPSSSPPSPASSTAPIGSPVPSANSPAGAPSSSPPSPTSSAPTPSPESSIAPTGSPVPFENSPAEAPSASSPSPTSLSPEQPTPTPAGSTGSPPGSSPPASDNQVSPPNKANAMTILPSSLLVSLFSVLITVAILHKY
ncbi:early nodulin-like protein 2 [Cannabis sativa]|uniref:Phytocyanin domain-containing protein n=1 Tax=Cannabis sativa TaxID=3483 RepID=A0A7J6GUK0_CANSA|nr:early nodulin-like protein 2 [Cannabis sativa]KAF4386624.1 hypothetical protein F8388_006579 [Cannabis sativa]KAF4392950.1 hypothetical protein G4B88_011945 [Cannabis sativa]